ncbi:MAG: AzlD domain-containing protein [Succinivibrio sp.]
MEENTYLWLIVAVMALATYPLRMLPATVFSKARFGRYMRRVLHIMPYTALTALVFPGVFFSVGDHYAAAGAGVASALLLSLLKAPLSLTVAASVAAAYIALAIA